MRGLEHHVGGARVLTAGLRAGDERHQVPSGGVRQRASEAQEPVVDGRFEIGEDVAHQPDRAPRSRNTSTSFAAISSASPSSIVA